MLTEVDVSYLANTVMLLRYFEAEGVLRQVLPIVKQRVGPHERTLRELSVGIDGVVIGEQLTSFQGVLTGVPNFTMNHNE